MIEPPWVRTMAAYNRWMNRRLYEIVGGLDEEARRADRGAFFGSIHATLDHILYADLAFLSRFTGEPAEPPHLGVEICPDFQGLRAARAQTDRRLCQWAEAVEGAWLAAPFTYRSRVDGAVRTRPAWLLVTHLFNHQSHHRGQVTTLLSQRGIDPGVTDLAFMPEEETSRSP